MLSIGIDSALREHQVEIQNDRGEPLWRKKVKNDRSGLDELFKNIDDTKRKTGDSEIVGIFAEAIGSYFAPFQHHLSRMGYRVVIVHPIESKSARKIRNLDKYKTDAIDASVLASLPWMDKKYREQKNHKREDISELTRLYQNTLEQSTRLQNHISSDLTRVFPEFKQKIKDLDLPTNLELLRRYPTPSMILAESETVLVKLVRKQSRSILGEQFVKDIREMAQKTIGVPDESGVIGYRITYLVERLLEVQKALKSLSIEIKKRTENIEGVKFFVDIIGIERVRAASLYGELGSIEQFASVRNVQGYGGVTPRIFASGNMEMIGRPTKAVNHYLRNTVSVAARSLAQHSDEFKAVFVREKLKGKSNTQAYIVVGNRLLYHVYSILKNNKPYRKRMPVLSTQYTRPTVSH